MRRPWQDAGDQAEYSAGPKGADRRDGELMAYPTKIPGPTNFEKYLAGEPLNDELAAIRQGAAQEGRSGLATTGLAAEEDPVQAHRPLRLTNDDRFALKELRYGPAWPALQKILDRETRRQTDAALSLSQDDPLRNRDEIAKAWHHLNVWQRMVVRLADMVGMEIKTLIERVPE